MEGYLGSGVPALKVISWSLDGVEISDFVLFQGSKLILRCYVCWCTLEVACL